MKSSKGSSLRYTHIIILYFVGGGGWKGSQSLGRENVSSVGKNPFQVQGPLDAKIGGGGLGGVKRK